MIVIDNFPLGPSANELYEPNVRRYRDKSGKLRVTVAGYRKGKVLSEYMEAVELYKSRNIIKIIDISKQCKEWLKEGYVLRVDTYHAFQYDRVWTVNKKAQRLDANNRVKACLDAVANMIGVDDKYFFDGDCGKLSCDRRESECTIIKISPMKPMTLDQIRQKLTEAS